MPVDPERVDKLFYRAQEMPQGTRAAFLAQACGEDAELRREVQSLLNTIEDTRDDFLERPLLAGNAANATTPEGRRLGAFRILREIGHGGMSRVFLAIRDDDEIQQQVAVKVLKWGTSTREAVRRFRRERQILAHVEHPFVARFLDAGTTDDDLPYVVMEHVEGQPITRYCETHRLSIRERLQLFRKVCSAVQFAHQNLIIHRDLKPGNVLVTTTGTPKLLDFGIAKLLPEDPLSSVAPTQSYLTATGLQPMTLAYASPEQIRGGSITTSSDVYSLGVILYQLLTGLRPYGRPDDSALELARAVCEEIPTKPSTAVQRDRQNAGRRRRLSGDLDSIVLKALEKDPRRRYASVEQFSEDIHRYLEGQPVNARDATVFYRVGRYLRRHRLEVTAVLAIFLVILGFSIHSTILRNQAVEERKRAEEVTRFMLDMLRQTRPEEARGEEISARQVLDQFAVTLDEELIDQPALRGTLMDTIGAAYLALGLYDKAEPFLEKAISERREARPAGLLQLAHLRMKEDRYDEARTLVYDALKLLRRQPSDSPDLARALNNLAVLEKRQGNFPGAEKLYRESLAMKTRLFGEKHEDVAKGQYNLAITLRSQGKYGDAEALSRESLELRIELYGEKSAEVAKSRNNLALILQDQGDLASAEPLLRQALEIRREIYGETHPDVATALNNLGFLLYLGADLDEAEGLYRRALEIRQQRHGLSHSSVAHVLRNLAALFLARNEPTPAEILIRQALAIFRGTLPDGHWRIADATSVFGQCLIALERLAEAEPLLRGSYLVLEAELGSNARQTREARDRLKQLEKTSRIENSLNE